MTVLVLALLVGSIIPDVRTAATSGNLAGAEQAVRRFQQQNGVTTESIEAFSWLARAAAAAKKYDLAERYSAETVKQVQSRLGRGGLDADAHLPTALGAAIEVQGQVLEAKEGRAASVAYLQGELAKYRNTSIATRIQKNINLRSLEGRKAPPLEGAKLPVNRPALLFFWAHWCPDCKAEAPIIAALQRDYPNLVVIGPTQLYGYAEGGEEAGPDHEKSWIRTIQQRFYSGIHNMPTPVSAENFKAYGASSTPTLVLTDRQGVVRLYHPGAMGENELRAEVAKVVQRAN